MIRPSRRRQDDARERAFDLHDRLARSEAWHRKLTVAGGAALALSVIAWLSGAPLGWHAALVAVGFAGGLAWPVRDADERALAWIAQRVGLVYETALQGAGSDAFGFHRAVEERARTASARLRFPPRQRWWIASLALAVGLLLLPVAQSIAPGGSVGGAPGPEATAPAPVEETSEEDAPEPERPEVLDRASEPDQRSGGQPSSNETEGGASGGSEAETLSRFLDNLRERDPFEPVEQPQGSPEGASGSEQEDTAPGEQRDGEARSESDTEGSEGEEGEEGASAGGEGTPEEGEREGDEGRAEEGPDEGEGEGTPGQEEGGEQGSDERDAQGAGVEPGDEEGELQPDATEGAGADPTADRPADRADGATQEDPDFLSGQLEQGPENPGGSVLLPGETEVDVPQGLRSTDYRRAVEEAVTDGQIPLEYQEIIRNYFR